MIKANEPISKRLQIALSKKGLKQNDLVERTGIPKGSISQYVSGFVEPKSDRIYQMAKALDVNPLWLMGVDTEMDVNSNDSRYSIENAHLLNQIKHDDMALTIMKRYFELTKEQKKSILTIMEGMAKNNQ